MPLPLLAIAALAGSAIKGISGAVQKNRAHGLLNDLGDSPNESIPDEVYQNQAQAKLNANVGLPSEQYNQAMKNLQRQQLMQLKQANDRRGGLAVLAGGQQNYDDSLLKLDVANSQARLQNQKTLYGINNNIAGWKDKVWGNNVRDKWNRKYQYAMSLLGAGNQNFTSGIDGVIGAGLEYAGGQNGGGQSNGDIVKGISKMPRLGYNPTLASYK